MSIGFAFALLLTLQGLHLVSTQSSNLQNEDLTPSPFNGIPDEWKRENLQNEDLTPSPFNGIPDEWKRENLQNEVLTPSPFNGIPDEWKRENLQNEVLSPSPFSGIPDEWKRENELKFVPEEESGISPDSIQFSGYDGHQDDNQTVIAVTEQNDDNANTTESPQTMLNVSSDPTKIMATSIQQDNSSNPVTSNPYLGPSTTSNSHVNLTGTNTTTPSPGNSTNTNTTTTSAPAFNITQKSTVSGNFTTTQLAQNHTKSPSENSANTTEFTTTTMLNHTNDVLVNETSTASTTKLNRTGGSLDVRENVDRGLSSDIQQQTKSQAWGAILGIGVAVAIVALVIYTIVKRRNYRDFSHRKLVEDMPPEPVLRLDNSEPLDLKFDGSAYYNPGIQGDNIQMTNFPQGLSK